MDSTAQQFAPDAKTIRWARLALAISFFTIGLLGGGSVFAHWAQISIEHAISFSGLFVFVMGAIHVLGYRLWLSQGSRASVEVEVPSIQDSCDLLISALKTGLIWQLVLLIVTALTLDCGEAFSLCLRTSAGYLAGVVLICIRFLRRRKVPTKGDLIYLRYGSPMCLYLVVPIIGVLLLCLQHLGFLPPFLKIALAR